MNYRSLVLVIIIFLIGMVSAHAQDKLFSVKGIVVDSISKKPVEYVTVSLKKLDSVFFKNVLTNDKGMFLAEKLNLGKYMVTVMAIGYNSKSVALELTDSTSSEISLTDIVLSVQSTMLKNITVTGSRPLLKREIDRLVYDVQADPGNKIETALDIMRKVPLLTVDAEGNLELKGSANYKVLVNGKSSNMFDNNLKDILRSMPASGILKIEVITNPPAKYDSEGLAGIINIITAKKIGDGYNGTLNISDQFPVGGLGGGGTFVIKHGKFGISSYGGIDRYHSPSTTGLVTRNTTGDTPTNLLQMSKQNSDRTSGYLGTELSYEADSLNLITAGISFNKSRTKTVAAQFNQITDASGNILQLYNLNNYGRSNPDNYGVELNYQLGFKHRKEELLTFSYKYDNSSGDQFNNLGFYDRKEFATPDYQQFNETKSREQTFQADYTLPVNKKLSIEAGLKDILRNNNSDFQYQSLNSTTGVFEPDSALFDRFRNNQNILGTYISGQFNLNSWILKAGVRAEGTRINADFISSRVKRNYFNVIPSFSVNKKINDLSSLNFGFAQRIQRPDINTLNPFVDRSNPSFETSGNPNLSPALSNNIELNYSITGKGSINIGLNYMAVQRAVQMVTTYDSVSKKTFRTFENLGKEKSLGSNFSISYPITDRWNFNLNGLLNYIWIEGIVGTQSAKNSGVRGTFSAATDYRFNEGWKINSSFQYYSPRVTLQGTTNALINSSFAVSKDIINGKFTLSASVNNPFTKFFNYVGHTEGDNFYQTGDIQFYQRSFNVGINYRFGKLKEEITRNKRSINNEDYIDLKGGGK